MALEKAFQELTSRLRKLRDAVDEVRLTVVEDRPAKHEAVIVDHFEYGVEDILGWLEDAFQRAAEAQQAAGMPLDLNRARRSLGKSHELFQKLQLRYSSDLISYARLEELTGFGRQRRGEWQGWTESVKKGLEHCRQPMEDAGVRFTWCWQELAEHLGTMNVSVHATNIGQRITSASQAREFEEEEGVT